VGTVVDHKEFLDQFPAAILKLIRLIIVCVAKKIFLVYTS